MKIAIWGYGRYGRRMLESLTQFCSDEYEVVRVYDTAYQTLKFTDGKSPLKIHNPEELLEDYKHGLFEKVLISIHYVSQKPRQFLWEHSIPELHLGSPDDLYSLSYFKQGEKPFEINRAGFDFHVLKEIYAALPNFEKFEMLYLFDDEGKIIKEHADRFDPDLKKACFFDYPLFSESLKQIRFFFRENIVFWLKNIPGIIIGILHIITLTLYGFLKKQVFKENMWFRMQNSAVNY